MALFESVKEMLISGTLEIYYVVVVILTIIAALYIIYDIFVNKRWNIPFIAGIVTVFIIAVLVPALIVQGKDKIEEKTGVEINNVMELK